MMSNVWRRCDGFLSNDRGSASVWVLAAGLVVVTVGMSGALLAAAMTGRHQAQVAADMAALAAARLAVAGQQPACRRAAELVSINGAQLARCQLDGLDVQVTVTVPVTRLGHAQASARAGPIEPN